MPVARCRGWMERQSSLLDEFFLFSRRSFKNGRLACKSARDLVSWIYFDYFFSPSYTKPSVSFSSSLFVSRSHTFTRQCLRIDSPLDSPSVACISATLEIYSHFPWKPFIQIYTVVYYFAFSALDIRYLTRAHGNKLIIYYTVSFPL